MGESTWTIPLSDLAVGEDIVTAVEEAVASGWWSMGPRVIEFERAFAEFCGARHALAVANGTAALHLALLAVGCEPGDEVLVPSLNFVAAANTICHAGATPVFLDITGPDELNLDPDDLEAAIGPATKGVVVMHYGGYACDMEAIGRIAEERGLWVIEDAAHAPGGTWDGRQLGTFGRIGCFSFFSNKNLPVGEGGMLVTDDDELAALLRLLRSHGMTALTWDRHRGHAHSYDVVAQGFNYRLDELRAAIGLVQLRRLGAENAARARLVDRYRTLLHGKRGVVVPFAANGRRRSSCHIAVAVLPEGVSRADVRSDLAARGIQTSVHYPPIHAFSHYAELGARRALPRTDAVAERVLTLPLYAHLEEEQVDTVAEALLASL
jgi:dTDP-4-amino-4,6-dideoxygalactose transaminase